MDEPLDLWRGFIQADALAVLGPLAWKLQCLQDDIAQSDSEDDSEDEVM